MPYPLEIRSVRREVADILRYVLRDSGLEIAPDQRLDDLPMWDSMHHVTAVVEAECRFGIEFDLDEIDSLRTVSDLIRMIETKTLPQPV